MSPFVLLIALAPAVDAEVQGYVEARSYGMWGQADGLGELAALGLDFDALGIDPTEHWSVISRLRPTVKLHLTEESTLVATAKGETRHGFFVTHPERIEDVASVERLYLTLHRGPIDLIAGKQLITFGSGLVLNPTDVLNDKPVNDLAAERPGVWAVLATLGLGDTSNLHAAAAVESGECCDAVVLGRYDHTLGDTDLAATVAWRERREQLTLGLDVKGELELGLWTEGAWVMELRDDAAQDGFLLLEVGADYSFDVFDQLYLALEWIHQGDGAAGPAVGASGDPVERRLLGSNYLLLLARLTLSTRWQAQWLNLANLRDPSGTSVLQLTWLPADWLEVTAGAQGFLGEAGTEFHPTLPDSPLLPPALRAARLQPAFIGWLWLRAYY